MKIEKRAYSRSPWRLVTASGAEVYASIDFDHPDFGMTRISAPICGETKSEVTEKALKMLETLLKGNYR